MSQMFKPQTLHSCAFLRIVCLAWMLFFGVPFCQSYHHHAECTEWFTELKEENKYTQQRVDNKAPCITLLLCTSHSWKNSDRQLVFVLATSPVQVMWPVRSSRTHLSQALARKQPGLKEWTFCSWRSDLTALTWWWAGIFYQWIIIPVIPVGEKSHKLTGMHPSNLIQPLVAPEIVYIKIWCINANIKEKWCFICW